MPGYDTAGEIQNTYVSAHDEFGADPAFWVRYFNPSPAADLFENDPSSECSGAWDSGGPYVGCVSAPSQGNLSSSSAQGLADAQSFAAAIQSAYYAVTPLDLPANNALYCWLDQEYSTTLSLDYWDGWSNYIANYNFASLGTYPLFPALYCTPDSPYPNCTTIGEATGLDIPSAVWSAEWEPCGSLTDPPAWDAQTCSPYSSVPTLLWQFGEQGACGYSANVDLDEQASGFDYPDYCLRVLSNP
jgi:hypothetical protein